MIHGKKYKDMDDYRDYLFKKWSPILDSAGTYSDANKAILLESQERQLIEPEGTPEDPIIIND